MSGTNILGFRIGGTRSPSPRKDKDDEKKEKKEKKDKGDKKEKKEKKAKETTKSHPTHLHPLSHVIPGYEAGWRCDLCKKEGKGIPIWHCEPCSYDVCDGCMNQAQATPATPAAASAARGIEPFAVGGKGTAAIPPSAATFEDLDPTRSSQGFLETFALSASRMDALCLATPATDDAFYYAGLQLLHANNGTGGAEWPAFYQRYTALFGSGSQRAKELDWRARFARYEAGMMSQEEAREFLNSIASEMRYGPERDTHGKIVRSNSYFRSHGRNPGLWQPKERRGLSWPSASSAPPSSASYPNRPVAKRHGMDVDMGDAKSVPIYVRAYWDGDRKECGACGGSSYQDPSLSILNTDPQTVFYTTSNALTLKPVLVNALWELYNHPSQPNFLPVLNKYVDAKFIARDAQVTSFMALSEKDRRGRSVEDVKAEAENNKRSDVRSVFQSRQAKSCMLLAHLNELMSTYGSYVIDTTEFAAMYIGKLCLNADVGSDWATIDLSHKTAFYDAVTKFCLACEKSAGALLTSYYNTRIMVLYHWLEEESKADIWNWDRFREFIAVPRNDHTVQDTTWLRELSKTPELLAKNRNSIAHISSGSLYPARIQNVGDGSVKTLVAAYLTKFYEVNADVQDASAWKGRLNDSWVRSIIAMVRLLGAKDKPAKWLELLAQPEIEQHLPSGIVKQLQDRIDLELAPTNRKYYTDPETPLSVSIYIKNIRQLVVKVFEINTEAFYKSSREEITTDINLDGLAANIEQVFKYEDASPLQRVLRTFSFPELGNNRGVFVIEFIAAGKSSRALIRRGGFRFTERMSVAGQVLTVLDEKNNTVKGVKVLVDANEYTDVPPNAPKDAAPTGEVVVPFSSSPNARRAIVIQKGDYACLDHFSHKGESYSLACGFVVDREQLIKDGNAQILVRTALYLNEQPVSLQILEDVTLTVTTQDKERVSNTKTIKDFKLFDDRESAYIFRVPDDLRNLNLQLTAKVTVESSGSGLKTMLSGQWSCQINQSDDRTDSFYKALLRTNATSGGYELLFTGKTGEPRPFHTTNVTLKNRYFANTTNEYLSADANGVIKLGDLTNIQTVSCGGEGQSWEVGPLASGLLSLPASLHGQAREGIVCVAPYLGDSKIATPPPDQVVNTPLAKLAPPSKSQAQLFSLAGDSSYLADLSESNLRFDPLRGLINLINLTPGDYDLYYPRQQASCRVRVAQVKYPPPEPKEGESLVAQQYVLGTTRFLEAPQSMPVLCVRAQMFKKHELPQSSLDAWERCMASLRTADEDAVRVADDTQDKNSDWLFVQLSSLTPATRVHIFCTEFFPQYDAYEALNVTSAPDLGTVTMANRISQYLDGRILGEEYRYVLDRKHAPRRLGNMNRQPTLLLNPWAISATDTSTQLAAAGTSFASLKDAASRLGAGGARQARGLSQQADRFALDFLGDASTVLSNIRPSGKSYSLAVPRAALGAGGLVRVFVVDGLRVHSRATQIPRLRPPKLDAPPADAKDVAKWKEQQAASKSLLKDHPHKDLRLLPLAALPPRSHFVERRATESFLPGKQLVVSDITPATLGLYDSVAKMHSLFTALAPNANLQQFSFLSNWGTLSDAEKSSLYSQYACHELHFFIYRKDEPFFRRAVRPHIAQKLEKQLIDYWLLSATEGTDDPRSLNNDALKVYLEPARFEALNYLERILLYHRAHRCGIWPWPGPTGGIVQHLKDLQKRAAQEGRTVTELDDPILFKNALSCGGLDPDAIKAALAAAGAIAPQQQQQPPPPPPSEDISVPEMDEDEGGERDDYVEQRMSAPRDEAMPSMLSMPSKSAMSSLSAPSAAPSAMASMAAPSAPRRNAAMPSRAKKMEEEMECEEAPPAREEKKMSKKKESKERAAPEREKEKEKQRSRSPPQATPDLRQAQAQAGKQAQLATDLARRGNVQQAFKQLEKTQEWAESQYYQQQPKALDQHSYVKWEAQRCQMNAFWIAVAEQVEADRNFLEMAPAGQQRQFRFLSPAYITAGRGSFTDQVFAMALIDLPFAPPQLSIQFAPSRVVITSAEPFIAFYRDLGTAPTDKATTGAPVAVEQTMFDPNFRTQANYDNNTSSPYWVTKEFEVNKIYGCQVKVTGQPGCPSQKFDVMTQIPVGALPIGANGFYTRSHVLQISAGSSQQVSYHFYFPVVGKYDHYPAHVSAGNQLVAFAAPFQFNVVTTLTPPPSVPQPPVDKTTWEYISQEGTPDEVFAFLDTNGPHNYNLDYILFRCDKVEFWQRAAAALRKRHVVHNNILCWCFHFENADGIAEYLSHPILHQTRNSSFNNLIRAPFKSKLWRKDEDYQALYQHLEYAPLVNARAHTLGQVRKILNSKFGGQYTEFLQLCARKPQPDATDFMAAAYYLLLQDRIDEARRMFERIATLPTSYQGAGGRTVPLSKGQPEVPAGLQKRDYNALLAAAPVSAPIGPAAPPNSPRYFATQIQYDYLAAYLDFLDERHRLSYTVPPVAAEMCGKYKNYPVSRWAQRFQDMDEQVKEITALVSTAVPAIAVEAPTKEDAKSDLKAEVSKDDNKPDPERMRVLLAKMWQRTRPSFDMSVNGKQLVVDFANVPDVQLRFYVMDLELLFSTQPFFVAERSSGGSADKKQNSMFIKPNITLNVALPAPAEALLSAAAASGAAAPVQSHSIPIPDKIADSNLIIEAVVPGGIRKTLTYFANSLLLSVQPSVGQLQVLERPAAQGAPSRPIAGAYVKVYAKLASGGEPFWKDLYTDLRGRADYCSLSDAAADLGSVKSFSILIVTEKNGSVIREVAPPGL